jgi:hypothetical protein
MMGRFTAIRTAGLGEVLGFMLPCLSSRQSALAREGLAGHTLLLPAPHSVLDPKGPGLSLQLGPFLGKPCPPP